MTADPVFAAFTKLDSATLVTTYAIGAWDGTATDGLTKSFVTAFAASHAVFANSADTQAVAGIRNTAGVGAWVLGPGGSTAIDVSVTRTGVGAATVLGTLTIPSPILTTAVAKTSLLTDDGTGGHGQAGFIVNAFAAECAVFQAPGDTQPSAAIAAGAGPAGWFLGPGGSTVPDVKVTRTGVGTATVVGTLTIPAPVITGHPVIEGVTSTGATGTGNHVFSASPTLTGTLTAATSSFSGHMTIEGVTSTGATGTGKFVFDASPTLSGTPVVSGTKFRVIDGTAAHGAVDISAGNIGINIAGINVFGTDGDTSAQVSILTAAGVGSISFGAGGATAQTVSLAFSGTNALAVTAPGGSTFNGKVVSSLATGGVGYSTGAGGAVTQLTSKSTAFPTISKVCGTLTWNNAALASDTSVTASSSTNTAIAATDTVVFNHVSGGTLGAYTMTCTPAAGTWTLTLRNTHSGSLSEAPVFAFSIIKAVTS